MLFQFFRVGHVAVVFNIQVKNNNSKGIVTSYYGNINNYSDRLLQYGTKKTCMETCRWCNFSGTVFGGGRFTWPRTFRWIQDPDHQNIVLWPWSKRLTLSVSGFNVVADQRIYMHKCNYLLFYVKTLVAELFDAGIPHYLNQIKIVTTFEAQRGKQTLHDFHDIFFFSLKIHFCFANSPARGCFQCKKQGAV